MENLDKDFEYEKLRIEHDWRLTEMRYRQNYQTRVLMLVLAVVVTLGTFGVYVYKGTSELPRSFVENLKESEVRISELRAETRSVLLRLDEVVARYEKLAAVVDELRARQRYLEVEIEKLKRSPQ